MCGIIGCVYGPDGPAAEKLTPSEAMTSMFRDVEHRGQDAFGWMHLSKNNKIQLRKFAQKATKGLDKLKPEHRFGIPNDVQWVIGHVRLATHGSPNFTHNNHPIVHGNTLGVHNGIVYNYDKVLRETGRQHKKAEVDSEALFAAIDHFGIAKGLDKNDALAALAFVDRREPNKVWLATLDANPLIVARSKGGATYFASEAWILDALKIEWEDEPWKLGDYTLYLIKDGKEDSYVQWADPVEKNRSGYGRYYGYSSGSQQVSGYNNYMDEDWMDMYDPKTHTTIGGKRSNYETLTGFVPDEQLKNPVSDEWTVECLNCNWAGDEFDCESGECPKCGSFQYLVPFGVVGATTKKAIVEEIDMNQLFSLDEEPWIDAVIKRAWEDVAVPTEEVDEVTASDEPEILVVTKSGTVMKKSEYDLAATVDKVLENAEGVVTSKGVGAYV